MKQPGERDPDMADIRTQMGSLGGGKWAVGGMGDLSRGLLERLGEGGGDGE